MTASLRTVSGVIALVAIAGVQTIDVARAQSEHKPDFSGRWVLEKSELTPFDGRTVIKSVARELRITQDANTVTVQHVSGSASHPRPAFLTPRSLGNVGTSASSAPSLASSYDVFWFGSELIVSINTREASSRQLQGGSSEKWSLESNGRLVVHVIEERAAAQTEKATLTYRKR